MLLLIWLKQMSKDKTIIKRETWFRVFSSKLYEEFLNEWLTLHQTYFETNPLPPKKLLGELSFIVFKLFY